MSGDTVGAREFSVASLASDNIAPNEQHAIKEGRGGSKEKKSTTDEKFENADNMKKGKKRKTNVGEPSAKQRKSIKKRKTQSETESESGSGSGSGSGNGSESEGQAMLLEQIQALVDLVATMSNSQLRDFPGYSITEVMDDLNSLPNLDPMSDLFMFATVLLEEKTKREVYFLLKEPRLKVRRLEYHYSKRSK